MYGPGSYQWMQDNFDVWNNSMDLAGIQNGGVIGFKYFGFGGLAQDTKGVKAFEGTKKGDDVYLHLNLTISGKPFEIHVMLDDPWKGQKLCTLKMNGYTPGHPITVRMKVPAVEGLTGKHAIYLVAEGPEVKQPEQPQRGQFGRRPQEPQRPQGLFDLHGIGFSKGTDFEVPVVPQVTITADGKKLNIPATPIRSTNQNGYTDLIRYQVYGPLKASTKLAATSDVPGVKFQISPVTDGRATVKATYLGKEKIFLIN
jgi:hypothetical protein